MTDETQKLPEGAEHSDKPDSAEEAENTATSEKAEAAVRPERPEYGEYATPQEQAKAIAKSLPTPSLAHPSPHAPPRLDGTQVTGAAPSTAQPRRPAHPIRDQILPPPRSTELQSTGSPQPASRPHFANRLVTTFLLALGLVYLLGGVASYLDLAQTIDLAYEQWGIGKYTSTALTAGIGVAIVVAQFAIWIYVAVVSFRRMRQGKITWWIPLVGAVVSLAISAALMATLLSSDPAFTTFLTTN